MKAAFIGLKQYSDALRSIGIDCFSVESAKDIPGLTDNLKKEGYGIIFTSQDIVLEDIKDVVVLPGLVKKGESNFLKNIIKKAIGKDIKI